MSAREQAFYSKTPMPAGLAWAARATWGALARWLGRTDVRAALLTTFLLRLFCSALAAAMPLMLPGLYPWLHPYPSRRTPLLLPPGMPHPIYSLLDYLARPWERWDTEWYVGIAQHGYVRYGSTAFLPLYPLLMRGLAPLAGGHLVAGLLLSTVAAFFVFLGLYVLSERLDPGRRLGPYVLLVAALLPTSFFFMAAYTESLFLALALWAVLAALAGRWGCMALLGGLAALTRQQGALLALLALPAAWPWVLWVVRRLATARRPAVAPVVPAVAPHAPSWAPLLAMAAPPLAYASWLVMLRLALHAPEPWQVLASPQGWHQHVTWPGSGVLADLGALRDNIGCLTRVRTLSLEVIASLAGLAALVVGVRRLPAGLSLYLAAVWCSGLVKVTESGQTTSEGRYMLALLPLCVLPAGWLARDGWVRRAAWVGVGLLGLMLYLVTFVLGNWVA
jgi:hypothetical protein